MISDSSETIDKRMRDISERKIGGYLEEEQKPAKKPTPVKPVPLKAQPNVSLGFGSSFQPWRKHFNSHHHKLPSIAEDDKYPEEENIIVDGGATSGATNDVNTANTTNEAQANKHTMDCDNEREMEKKLRRTLSNRHSARRSRLRKIAYVTDMESKVESFKEKIALLHQQIAAQQLDNRLLQIEHHRLKFHMAVREKQRIVQDVAMEKNRAEVDRLTELRRKLVAESQARMLSLGSPLNMIPNSNSGLGGLDRRDLDQALNGAVISKIQVDTVLQPQNQRNLGIIKWDTHENRSIPNFNLMKSEHES